MGRFIKLAALLFGFSATAMAAGDVYIADSAAGANDGTNCANAKAKSYFNTSGNWSATPTGIQIGPDVIAHICGTINGLANTTGLAFQGSGTVGHPVTLKFETGAIVQAPYWASSLGGTSAGGVTTNGQSNLVIDGGTNGIVQDTANGSSLANHQASTGISGFGCTNCEVKNLTIANIYVNVNGNGALGDNSVVRGIDFSGTGWSIHDNVLHDCGWCIVDFYSGTSSNHQLYNNQIYNFGHAFAVAAAASGATLTSVFIHDNDLHDTTNWDAAGCPFHMDGLHAFGTTGSSMDQFYFYNNYIHGNWGSCPTGFVFIEGGSGTPAHMHTSGWWNNVAVVQTSIVNTNGWFGIFSGGEGSTTTTLYNNTIVGPNATDNTACFNIGSLNGLTFRDNTVSSCGDPVNFGSLTSLGTINNNFYGPSCQNGNNCFVWNGSFTGSFTNWKAACGCDTNSAQSNAPLLNTDGSPQAGSPAIGLGANLSASATGNLASLQNDTTKGNTRTALARPSTGAWDSGAYQTSGPASSVPFTQTNTCGTTLAPGASCTFSVTFKPTVLGAQSANISIADNASNTPQLIPLTGTGVGTPNPALSPASLTFSNQLVGTSSSSQPITLTNNGTAPLTINSITASGDYAQTNNCASPLAVSAACAINVTFTPTAPGTRSGSLVVSSNGPGSPNTAALSGTGIQGAIALAPTSLTFTPLNVGSTSAGQVIAISNPGTATVTLSSVALTGTNAADFGLTNGCGATLTAGASCNATITFAPSVTGSRTASLTVTDSAPGSPHQAPLTGTGTAPIVSLTPSTASFGNQITGSISSAQNLTLSNTGTGSLTISSIALTGTNANQFAQTSTCGATLGAGASCTIAIRFAPTSVGAKSASLAVTDSATGSPHSSTLSGTGIAGAPVASLSPTSLTFSSTLLGVTSAGQVVTLQNTGTATLNMSAFAATGDFSQTNTCGATLAVNASCPITVRFTPTVAGTRTGNLTVMDDASGSPQSVPLSGTGTPPGGGGAGIAVFSPTSLTFPSQVTNTSSAAQVLTLMNSDTSTMSISTITFAGGNPTDYSQTNNCVPSLGAGASCTVNITFTPLGVGSRPATVVFTDSASDSPQSIPLSGTGIAPFPIVQLTPPSLDFGSIQQGSTTAGQTVAVKNIGTAILNISSITKTGPNAADYGLTNGCGATLAINATCTLTINFTPSSTGTRAASISIADDATNTPQAIPLTGVGTPAPAPKVSLSASSLSYTAQQVGTSSGSQSVTVTNIGDATLNITSILLGPPNATDYTLSNGCGATLAPAAACTLGVVFNPVAAGTRVSTVTLTDNASDSPQSFNLTGTAFTGTPTADLSVSTLIFLSQVVLTTSASQTIALTNNGTASLLITSIVASSDSAPGSNEFSRTTNCSGTLPAGASCTVNVTFTPQAIGARTGKVTFTNSASGSPQIVSLVGTGQNPPPPPGSAATGIGGRAGAGGKSGIGVH